MYKKNPIFLPGQKVCRKCQTRLSKEEDASSDGGEAGEGGGGGDVGAVEGGDESGVWGGGRTPSFVNTMDYVTIASTGNAADFGDLNQPRNNIGGSSNGHGGLS